MTKAVTVRLPDSLYKEIKQLAQADGISLNQFLTLAAAEKASALRTLRAEASKGNRADFDAFLAAVPDVEPAENDRL
jgi:uncharacterized protein (DUF1778 family)